MPRAEATHELARWLSKLGIASRTEAARMVRAGRVTVNGRVARDPELPCHPERHRIRVDGVPLRARKRVYFALHKPVGCITTARDPLRRPTAYDLLPAGTPPVQAAGRLDADSSGLLIFTNDTDFAARLTESGRVEKEYEVEVSGELRPEDAARFARGILLDGRRTRPARCEILHCEGERTLARVILKEGRNRQIRRMFGALGFPVRALHRVRVGAIHLGDLAPGLSRALTRSERGATGS